MTSVQHEAIENNPQVKQLAKYVKEAVVSLVGPEASFAQREQLVLAVTNEATRLRLQEDLQTLADEVGSTVRVDGELFGEHESGTVTYHSLCGGLEVTRSTYRRVAERNGPTIVPLDLAAGIIERATPALARNVAQGYAKHDMRSHAEDLESAARVPPSRTTLETMAKRIATASEAATPRIEAMVRRDERLPADATGIVIGLDRVATPMEEERADDAPPKTRRKERTTPYVRRPPPPVDVNFRMAYVATFAAVNQRGEAIVTRRYAASPAHAPEDLVAQVMADVRRALWQRPTLAVGVMQDGAPELWNLLRPALDAEPLVTDWVEGIDIFHLYKHLSDALKCIERRPTIRATVLDGWKQDLDARDSAIDVIENYLLKRYDDVTPSKAEDFWAELVYIRNNKDRMRYIALRARGLPIGSGVTEGAAKSVVGKRAKGSGRRWHDGNLHAVLNLRAIYCSDRLPSFWEHFSRDYTARVEAVA